MAYRESNVGIKRDKDVTLRAQYIISRKQLEMIIVRSSAVGQYGRPILATAWLLVSCVSNRSDITASGGGAKPLGAKVR